MYPRIRETKYRTETVTFVWDFADHINPGDIISGVPEVTILVSSGIDNNPGDMIYHSPVVTNGTIVSQQIRRGIPGTIYIVTIVIDTVGGNTFEDLTYLAILPLDFPSTVFLQTMLYPIEMVYESIVTAISLSHGQLITPMLPEGIVSSILIFSGTIFGHPIYYVMSTEDGPGSINGHESIVSFIALISGSLFGGGTSYTMAPEGITSSLGLISGTIFGSPINYVMSQEGIDSFIFLQSGTLV